MSYRDLIKERSYEKFKNGDHRPRSPEMELRERAWMGEIVDMMIDCQAAGGLTPLFFSMAADVILEETKKKQGGTG
jgi:hypothetical protein